jgi:hypothetical protein
MLILTSRKHTVRRLAFLAKRVIVGIRPVLPWVQNDARAMP